MTEQDFVEIVNACCEHPRLYTPTGSFFEVASFLEGFAIASQVGETTHHSRFTPFIHWLIGKWDLELVIFDWPYFLSRFESDADALTNLKLLYSEYAISKAH